MRHASVGGVQGWPAPSSTRAPRGLRRALNITKKGGLMITQRHRTSLASFNVSRLLVFALLLLSLAGIAAADEVGEVRLSVITWCLDGSI